MTKSLDELRSQAKGRGRKGCRVCGEKVASYFSIHVKEPHVSQAGVPREKRTPSKSGGTIITRHFSFCEKHLVAAWDQCLDVIERLK